MKTHFKAVEMRVVDSTRFGRMRSLRPLEGESDVGPWLRRAITDEGFEVGAPVVLIELSSLQTLVEVITRLEVQIKEIKESFTQ